MKKSLTDTYLDLVASGEIEADEAQAAAVARFEALSTALGDWHNARRGWRGWLRSKRAAPPKGIYLQGAVGRGKTMLMDLFFGAVAVTPKRRLHFHAFMAETHERIGKARQEVDGDPIPHVAAAIAAEARLLCFDELHVTDIADAMILGRLFKGLFERDVVVVLTSNSHPDELYKNGLNRQLFLPFINLLTERMDEVELDVDKDFRLDMLAGQQLYFSPADDAARVAMDKLWADVTAHEAVRAAVLKVKGRKVAVPQAARGAARFSFADLCVQPLGSIDYLAIAQAYRTIFIDGVPELTPARRNEARRFINLIDTLYDQRVGLVISADAEPDDIYPEGDGSDLYQRTASRLIEMRSQSYLESIEQHAESLSGNDQAAAV
jgi:cell division protein ZapE